MKPRRTRFRFPVAAITFMSLAFVGVILAISMASRAAQNLTRSTANAYAGYPWFLLQPFVVFFVITLVVAVVAWAALFVQHRAGVHRLGKAQTWPLE